MPPAHHLALHTKSLGLGEMNHRLNRTREVEAERGEPSTHSANWSQHLPLRVDMDRVLAHKVCLEREHGQHPCHGRGHVVHEQEDNV
jgi:hypothetical protein